MGIMDSLKSLISTTEKPLKELPSTDYGGFVITPTPMSEGGQFRVCAKISKDDREHLFIRADLLGTEELCAEETVRKAQLMIDQVGDNMFG